MSYSRLDDRYVSDDVLRALLHQDMIKRVSARFSDNFQYTIKIDEVYRSDLAALRAYGNEDLRWVFRVLVGHESETEEMPAGTTLTLPDLAWLRNRIRDYAGGAPEIANG
ncbi:baseplate protein [Klebsiella grimontii]|uniref:baseplate protein n=1 Tax=Klebsiella grimontii TaxID=2058152 RepID=UPI000E343DA9|nr:baseplate protein [Klebsiella grimontii]RFP41661.1 baseplate protein [Klebsiella oxytoca]MBZ6971710.1 baseplate protein [Klebsiella grimontii]MBZ7826279.1 baseplate protein [Klebsiella grimontii]MDM4405829.1 baseplate protein [Klebsiella grimontii]QTP39142.1 baseplate protein [Klebsiella grimontii]